MPPTVIVVRHGEAHHSKRPQLKCTPRLSTAILTRVADVADDFDMPDPGLTERGIEQAKILEADLRPRLPLYKSSECRIVASPLRRTIETVANGLRWLQQRGVSVELRAEWQETSDKPCDVGTDPSVAQAEWPWLSFSDLDPVYPSKTGLYEATEEAYQRRAACAKQWLYERPEKCIIIVTHSGFIKRMMDEPKFQNVEYHVYEFVGGAHGTEPQLRQIDRERPLEHEEHENHYARQIGSSTVAGPHHLTA